MCHKRILNIVHSRKRDSLYDINGCFAIITLLKSVPDSDSS